MVLDVVFFGMTGLVLLLRLITKKLGAYLEMLADGRRRCSKQWIACSLTSRTGRNIHRQALRRELQGPAFTRQ